MPAPTGFAAPARRAPVATSLAAVDVIHSRSSRSIRSPLIRSLPSAPSRCAAAADRDESAT